MKPLSKILNRVESRIAKSALGRSDYDNPEWVARSLQIRDQRDFCEMCRRGERDAKLHVHHLFYDGRKLHEYKDDELMVLCQECHEEVHDQLLVFRKHVFRNLNPAMFRSLNGALGVALKIYGPQEFIMALVEFAGNERLVRNHAQNGRTRWQHLQPSN